MTANNKTKLLNAVEPDTDASYTGFVNGEKLETSGVTGRTAPHNDRPS